jgi:hypothetical protein
MLLEAQAAATARTERLDGRAKRLHAPTSPAADLPDGAMVLQDGGVHLILNSAARRWSHAGYGAPVAILGSANLITPPSTGAMLRAGYRPRLHTPAPSSSAA